MTEREARENLERLLGGSIGGFSVHPYVVVAGDRVAGSVIGQSYIYKRIPYQVLGWCLVADLWGQGIMTQAVRTYLQPVFAQEPKTLVLSECYADNLRSRRLMQSVGYYQLPLRIRDRLRMLWRYNRWLDFVRYQCDQTSFDEATPPDHVPLARREAR